MITKLEFISITGPKGDIDRVVNQYLSKYDFHLENALTELKTVQSLRPYIEVNPYRDWLVKAQGFLSMLDEKNIEPVGSVEIEEAVQILEQLDKVIKELHTEKEIVEKELAKDKTSLQIIQPFRELHYNIHSILDFKFIKFRFGRIPKDSFNQFQQYIYDNLDTIFYKCHIDNNYVWGVYFAPIALSEKVDAIYASMHFERIYLPDEYEGTPEEAYMELEEKIHLNQQKAAEWEKQIEGKLEESRNDLILANQRLDAMSYNFDVRRSAACTTDKHKVFYILCGWMPEKEVNLLAGEVEKDDNLYCIIEDNQNNIFSRPPTRLENPKIFKPFEMFIRMYGLPAYDELDPTIFVAITYAFIFGAMFGDVGQGLCLMIGGFLFYRWKKKDLAAIISAAGIFSTVFGFLFGSFFGFEDLINPLWMRPIDNMTTLPFIGKLNTVFVIAIAFGMGVILLTMVFHIINGIKAKDKKAIFFDTNGLAGFVFYASIVLVTVLFLTGSPVPAGIIMTVMFGIPLLLIALKEPLIAIIEKKAEDMPKGKGMFVVQTFFELFEVLLSYFSNTLSFVRIGAFAVSHAAMMEVVLMLAGAEQGNPNWIIIVAGNLAVASMEGLVVGIQVLRLEYFEMFSRFYKGTGREFIPYLKK